MSVGYEPVYFLGKVVEVAATLRLHLPGGNFSTELSTEIVDTWNSHDGANG